VNNPANVKTQYRELFTQEAVNTTEVIWARQMSVGMTTFHDLTWRYTSGSYGQRWSLDQDFVKTYLNLDGSRHTATGEEFTTEVENRDYRLSQSIITPGYTKLVGGVSTATPPDFTVTLTGYQVIKFNIDDKAYESASVSYNSLPIMRYAEVLLNYAEAKAELGEFSDDIWNKTIKPLRERAGVDGKRPTSADPYLQQYYGLSDSDLLEIRLRDFGRSRQRTRRNVHRTRRQQIFAGERHDRTSALYRGPQLRGEALPAPHPQDGAEHQPRPGTKLLLEINKEETRPGRDFPGARIPI